MTRGRVRPSGLQVALFPFLAVLICTMGVLIVLLVIVVKRADLKADQERSQETIAAHAEIEQLQSAIQEADFVADALDGARSDWTQQVQQATARRSHYESHARELRQQLASITKEAERLKVEPVTTDQKLLDQLQEQVVAKEQEAAAQRERLARAGTHFAVIAYDGRNGTQRRPIYIECTPQGIDLRPFDLHFDLDEFPRPILPGNPLDAAVLAIRENWQKTDPQGISGAPYPLILVRPGGSDAYAVVREALKSWDSEFGHQIVPQEMTLEFPPPETDLTQELERVVADARRRQQMLLASVRQLAGGSFGQEIGLSSGTPGNRSGAAALNGQGAPDGSDEGIPSASSDASLPSSETIGSAHEGLNASNTTGIDSGTARGSTSGSRSRGTRDFVLRASGRHGGFVPASGFPARDNRSTGFAASLASQPEARDSDRTAENSANSPAGGGSAAGGSAGQGPGGQQSMGSLSAGQPAEGSSRSDFTQDSSSPAQPLANTRGRGWALPVQSPTAIAFRRPLRVTCYPDRLVLHQEERSNQVAFEFPLVPSMESAMDPLVNQLQAQIETWGLAGDGAYWKPELHIDVKPGAEMQYEQLRVLLEGSGLEVKETSL